MQINAQLTHGYYIVGAKPSEVVAMNQLSVNLHLMLATFYKPTSKRFKIITEAGAFSSDQYILESQAKFHNLNPEEAIIELQPRPNEITLRTEDIIKTIEEHADQLAIVILGGVQYFTGQFFDIKKITEAGKKAGAIVGYDLAHAIGNVPLQLHKHNVDFAVWCGYKSFLHFESIFFIMSPPSGKTMQISVIVFLMDKNSG